MKIETADYSLDCSGGVAVLDGVLRLHSPVAYEGVFEGVREALLAATSTFVIDLAGVRFMNSSGITALSRLVLLARNSDKPLMIKGNTQVAWQQKTITSLQRLYKGLEVEFN